MKGVATAGICSRSCDGSVGEGGVPFQIIKDSDDYVTVARITHCCPLVDQTLQIRSMPEPLVAAGASNDAVAVPEILGGRDSEDAQRQGGHLADLRMDWLIRQHVEEELRRPRSQPKR